MHTWGHLFFFVVVGWFKGQSALPDFLKSQLGSAKADNCSHLQLEVADFSDKLMSV